ncbi:MAG TPA: helix-turn-helix domain-containing protein [Anaerolineae bacterium]|nr:helix-turn-helix domain-containing protein [Anaerolineae bacterium]HMR64154.1 helix-turn-helix domain-containing protein [Anaerolineae bacterium]
MNTKDTEFTFGQWLRRRRKVLDLTQAELAARVPCARGTIRRLEADDLRPSKPLAERLAEALDISEQMRANFILFARHMIQPSSVFDLFPLHGSEGESRSLEAALPLQSRRRYSMPAAVNPLIGRLHATEVVCELLLRPDVRLITLIGPPGVGKTQLAMQVARQIQSKFREGACFVPLATLREADQVLPAIAQAIDLVDSGRSAAVALVDRLQHEQIVLVLDNFEHIISAGPDIAALLSTTSTLKVLCTSRVPLRILGEHEFVVAPLALPHLEHLPALGTLEANPAVALFVERVRATLPGFAITVDNARQIAEICHRLDGLPLAIELAATRLKLFSPAALLSRLDQRLPLLTGGMRDAPARQRTLEAAIRWSYDLLNDAEKICLSRLGVFWGGWTLDAAEVICGDNGEVINTLASLVDHSLVQSNHLESGEVRFTMLETIREFALLRLQDHAETSSIQARHARYFLSLAVAGEQGLQGPDQVTWMQRLNADNNNLRAAFTWSLSAEGDAKLGLQAGASLWWFWWTNGQVGEGRQWLQNLTQRAENMGLSGTSDYGRALLGAGILAFFAGEFEAAMPQFKKARDLGEQLNDLITHGYAIAMIGTIGVLSDQGEEAYAVLDRGALILSHAGALAVWHVGVVSLAQALLSCKWERLDKAQRHADAGMTIFRQLGQPYGIGLAFNYQGDVARLRGDYALATERYQAALPLLRQAKAKSEIPAVLHNLAHVLLGQDQVDRGQALFAEALELHREVGNRMGMVECLIGLAAVAVKYDQLQPAAILLGAVETLLSSLKVPLFAAEQAVYQQIAETAAQALGQSLLAEARRVGQAMTLAEILEFASTISAAGISTLSPPSSMNT